MSRSIVQPLNLFIVILLAITWPVVATLEPKVDEVGHAPSGLYRARVALSQPTSRARLDELGALVEAQATADPWQAQSMQPLVRQAMGQTLDLELGEGVGVGAGFESVEVAAEGVGAARAEYVVEVGAAMGYPMCPHIGYRRARPS